MNKGHPRERQIMVFLDKWSLFGGYFGLFIKEGTLKCGLYLQGGLYCEETFNTGLTVVRDKHKLFSYCKTLVYPERKKTY